MRPYLDEKEVEELDLVFRELANIHLEYKS